MSTVQNSEIDQGTIVNTKSRKPFLGHTTNWFSSIRLQFDFDQFRNSQILGGLKAKLLPDNLKYEKMFKRLLQSDKITILLEYPEWWIKRVVDCIRLIIVILPMCIKLTMKMTHRTMAFIRCFNNICSNPMKPKTKCVHTNIFGDSAISFLCLLSLCCFRISRRIRRSVRKSIWLFYIKKFSLKSRAGVGTEACIYHFVVPVTRHCRRKIKKYDRERKTKRDYERNTAAYFHPSRSPFLQLAVPP